MPPQPMHQQHRPREVAERCGDAVGGRSIRLSSRTCSPPIHGKQATGTFVRNPAATHASARALLDATAIGELRDDLRRLFARMRELEAETVRRTGVGDHAPAFAVDVSCVIDVESGSMP